MGECRQFQTRPVNSAGKQTKEKQGYTAYEGERGRSFTAAETRLIISTLEFRAVETQASNTVSIRCPTLREGTDDTLGVILCFVSSLLKRGCD